MRLLQWGIYVVMLTSGSIGFGATYGFVPNVSTRQIEVVRSYDLELTAVKKNEVYLPAMMSFVGATNTQEIIDSRFEYSVEPNAIRIESDYLDRPRKYYCLTWNDPPEETIHVQQTMIVRLSCRNQLYTQTPYPYASEVLAAFDEYLGDGKNGQVVATDPALQPICEAIIAQKPATAQEAVQLVCDWVNDNIQFGAGSVSSSKVLANRTGDCGGMAILACAILRKLDIPADFLMAKFLQRNAGYHGFVEVYFPDAGWVFYDLSNWQRGFKIPNCLLTAGKDYRIEVEGQSPRWVKGYFCEETDQYPYNKPVRLPFIPIRRGPETKTIMSVNVSVQPKPESIRIRKRSLRDLTLDTTTPPGVCEYVSDEEK